MDESNDGIEEQVQTLENVKADHAKLLRDIGQQQQVMEKFVTKKSVLEQKKDIALNNIRDLGVLPEEAFEKHQDTESNTVYYLLI